MKNKEFYKILVTIQDLIADPNYEMLSAYVDSTLTKIELEIKSKETWLDRLEEATDCMRNDNESTHPGFCLAAFLGYGGCIHGTKLSCWECWKTPVKEIDTLKE